ncbi:methionyl-tRNA synthetase [Thermotoga maritima MSB8]|uniref:Methionine--tRNA ligase n=1 Tax=Thermotoga maritima (strain ATCC 43589 / DSM 3109 / JCM 10099 / NBRC 100826 / MSB8) TaxID=243274 RepID=SYM_THEMA|nr:methionine--tRNA ligase [Thermotoga maritima]O33925.1 RecName: Full=Methionine--tRNA ligase; AltName: Full=Methionyl-tRNA synthetase; Short=MetRS [Thermotoga maritima MSB8]AAB87143.1 methionyl-tRNA synthetase [Thermotoga maritima MSB8]AAD36162.1 methionyl-tRNA synthetase [Thermotoga maritima MSB8]AGL50013.1 Methionyl-tRNA synthetase [Thermotoga maritima MSB8]AHD19007.1 methionyl-tRNA synthetase [Thermotoga maritima MSB8]AKE26996.1 methionyl-tRNA synthetase [Thermotoga maritima]
MKFYITTPIYYVNSEPHIGSAYTTIVADIIARYKRFMGYDVFFLTGTDEHGQKVLQAAQQAGKDPQEFCDELAEKFKRLWKELKITNDYFIRTTDEMHMKTVQEFVAKMKENGDVYKGIYKGWYCVPCETFWNEDEVIKEGEERFCPECKRPVKWVEEENYFFRLSKYRDSLLKYYEEHPDFVEPDFRRNEMLKILEGGLKDLSITRTTFKWGVPMKDDPEHVIYVWVDALINYISAIGYGWNDEMFNKWWPADLHLIGKEINRFHSIIWPAMLMSVGLPLPKKVFAHGWLTVNGQKISKSLGNAIDPRFFVKRYGNDVVRYYLIRDIMFGKDGDFSEERLVHRLNSDLANDYGNLLHRITAMIKKYFNGRLPSPSAQEGFDSWLKERFFETKDAYHELMDSYRLTEALDKIWEFIADVNKYFNDTKPWILGKEGNMERLGTVLYNSLEAVFKVALMTLPVMPDTSEEVFRRVSFEEKPSKEHLENWGVLKPGSTVIHGEPLFKKIDAKDFKKVVETVSAEQNAITIDDFSKVDLRIAKVLEAEKVPNSRKLLRLIIDLGTEKRQIVAGIAEHYRPEELVGKLIVVVANLKPAKLMGIESQGMLLAAKSGDTLRLLTVDGEITPGAKVS